MKAFAGRFLSVCFTIAFFVGLFSFWEWIGLHFKDAPAQAVLGIDPVYVGMFLTWLVCIVLLFLSNFLSWLFTGK